MSGRAANAVLVAAPSPLAGEGNSAVQQHRWVRGSMPTPHPTEFADHAEQPSPARGEGTNTAASALLLRPTQNAHGAPRRAERAPPFYLQHASVVRKISRLHGAEEGETAVRKLRIAHTPARPATAPRKCFCTATPVSVRMGKPLRRSLNSYARQVAA